MVAGSTPPSDGMMHPAHVAATTGGGTYHSPLASTLSGGSAASGPAASAAATVATVTTTAHGADQSPVKPHPERIARKYNIVTHKTQRFDI